ncbi:MAG: hypothetical protein HYX75_06315 [Acidobacteria bacterium]|nr:hypothetical protein [Acidobacteriota bacterium]
MGIESRVIGGPAMTPLATPDVQSPQGVKPGATPLSQGGGTQQPAVPRDSFERAGGTLSDLFGQAPAFPSMQLPTIATNTAQPISNTSVPADVKAALDSGAETKIEAGTVVQNNRKVQKYEPSPALKADVAAVQQAIAKKDYSTAYKTMQKVNQIVGEKSASGSDEAMQTVERQLGFLSKLQEKGIKADYPPTQAQLVEYFGKLKGDPAAARQAFDDYTQTFHTHTADVKGKHNGEDVVYKSTPKVIDGVATTSPDQWSDVIGRPAEGAEHVGKQMNDCEGFAFMAEKLLTAAGFTLVGHVAVDAHPPVPSHDMALFKHSGEKNVTVTSNNRSFTAPDAMGAARHGYAWAAGERVDPNTNAVTERGLATGKEQFFVGKTGGQAMANLVNKNNPLK